jgi:hypothetical protein
VAPTKAHRGVEQSVAEQEAETCANFVWRQA